MVALSHHGSPMTPATPSIPCRQSLMLIYSQELHNIPVHSKRWALCAVECRKFSSRYLLERPTDLLAGRCHASDV